MIDTSDNKEHNHVYNNHPTSTWLPSNISHTYIARCYSVMASGFRRAKHARTCAQHPVHVNCWFHGSSFKGFSVVFLAPWLAKVESSQKSNGVWFIRHFFAPYLFHRSRNNRPDKLRSKFWREKISRKPHFKLLRWRSVRGTNKGLFHQLRKSMVQLNHRNTTTYRW